MFTRDFGGQCRARTCDLLLVRRKRDGCCRVRWTTTELCFLRVCGLGRSLGFPLRVMIPYLAVHQIVHQAWRPAALFPIPQSFFQGVPRGSRNCETVRARFSREFKKSGRAVAQPAGSLAGSVGPQWTVSPLTKTDRTTRHQSCWCMLQAAKIQMTQFHKLAWLRLLVTLSL